VEVNKLKSEVELFKQAYNEVDANDVTDLDVEKLISNYEQIYHMNTNEFRKKYEENGFEGNVDHQMWYKITT